MLKGKGPKKGTQIVWLAFCCAVAALGRDSAPKAPMAKVALLHFNPILGDLSANVARLTAHVQRAFEAQANIVVTPELATTGYALTKEQVANGLGIEKPSEVLSQIQALAIRYKGYAFVGMAEKCQDRLYNAVAVFGPGGLLKVLRKRAVSTWNTAAEDAFDVIPTPYGRLGVTICSDLYLPDATRILALQGADAVIAPANWWGKGTQKAIWATRARENGLWIMVANRWGKEKDDRFQPSNTYDMQDACSAVIRPDGSTAFSFSASQLRQAEDRILYCDAQLTDRIGPFTFTQRHPEAYEAMANVYFRADMKHQPPPGLPAPGNCTVASVLYRPCKGIYANLATLKKRLRKKQVDFLVLPGLGLTGEALDRCTTSWSKKVAWRCVQRFVDQLNLQALVTTVRVKGEEQEAVLVLQRGHVPCISPAIHGKCGQGQVWLQDKGHMRVAALTGRDALFPEMMTSLAKRGVDLVMVSARPQQEEVWNEVALGQAWQTATNPGLHVAVSDSTGYGVILQSKHGSVEQETRLSWDHPLGVMAIDSGTVRRKHLNAYRMTDLETLLSPCGPAATP